MPIIKYPQIIGDTYFYIVQHKFKISEHFNLLMYFQVENNISIAMVAKFLRAAVFVAVAI